MSTDEEYAVVPTAAMSALANSGDVGVEVFLPADGSGQPVLYKGAAASAGRVDLNRLRQHGVGKVYVRSGDLRHCEETLEARLGDLLADPAIAPADKAQIVHGAGTSVARAMLSNPASSQAIERASALADHIISCVLTDQQTAACLLQMAGHDRTIASHMHAVATLAILLGARVFGDDFATLRALGFAGMLHDLGKLSVPRDVLLKSGPLTREEFLLVQQHPIESVRLIGEDRHVPTLARQSILQHHERVDGMGYPLGLGGDELTPTAKVLTIVDSFHAMIGRRPYREPMSASDANHAMSLQAGKQFDEAFLRTWVELCAEYEQLAGKTPPVAASGTVDPEVAIRYEHASQKAAPNQVRQRPARHQCRDTRIIECFYAGRLIDATSAPIRFKACVHDISRGGICIYTLHPMYRGEIANLRIRGKAGEVRVRGMVAWCRQHDAQVYRVGLKFVERLAGNHIYVPAEVEPLGGLRPDVPSEQDASPRKKKSVTPEKSTRAKGDSAMERLAAIACLRSIPAEAQKTVIVMSMSNDVTVRLKTVDLLARIATTASREALIALLDDANVEVRERTAYVIGASEVYEAAYALRRLLLDRVETVRLTAAGALGRLNDWSGLRLIISVLEKDGPHLRAAVRAFGEITGHRFSASREGIQSARRYLAAKRKDLLSRAAVMA